MRLIRNIQGEPKPLIMHPRLLWLRKFDRAVRFWFCFFTFRGMKYKLPRYERSRKTPEQRLRSMRRAGHSWGAAHRTRKLRVAIRNAPRQSLLQNANRET